MRGDMQNHGKNTLSLAASLYMSIYFELKRLFGGQDMIGYMTKIGT